MLCRQPCISVQGSSKSTADGSAHTQKWISESGHRTSEARVLEGLVPSKAVGESLPQAVS